MVFCSRMCQFDPHEDVPLKPAGWNSSTSHQGGKWPWPQGLPGAQNRLGAFVNCASLRRHGLSDCNWEMSCFHTVWPGCSVVSDTDVLGKCMHRMPRKDLDSEKISVAFL